MLNKIYISLIYLIYFVQINAQDINLKIGFHGFLDNREYFNEFTEHQTFFGNRIYSYSNFVFENHKLNLGFDYVYEYGNLVNQYKPKLISNYQYENSYIKFILGTYPRKNNLNYPIAFLSDSLEYYRPLLEGSLFRFNYKDGHQQIWIDWTSRQTDTIRETFLAGISGHISFGNFFIENYILMYHHAKPKLNINNLHIRDNGGASLLVGYQYKPSLIFDSLVFKAGEFISYDRYRGVYDLRSNFSSYIGIDTYVKRFVFSGKLYIGDGLEVMYGEKIYRAPQYARFDIGFVPFKKLPDNIFVFSVHLVEGKIDYSQLINIHFNFTIPIIKL